jgi:hypothetical protein
VAGKVYTIDHKTGYKWDEKKITGYAMTGALVAAMIWSGMNYREAYGGMLVSGIDKAREGKPRPFAPPIGPRLIENFAWTIQDANGRLASLMASGRALSQWPRAMSEQGPCNNRYDTCAVMGACTRGPR